MNIPTVQPMNIINTLIYINPSIDVIYTGLRSYDSNLYTIDEQVTPSYVNSVFLTICKMLPFLNS